MPVSGSHSMAASASEQADWSVFAYRDVLAAFDVLMAGGTRPPMYVGWDGGVQHVPSTHDSRWSDMVAASPPWISKGGEHLDLGITGEIGELQGRRRDRRMRYLADNRMSDDDSSWLVDWLDDAEVSRLDALPRRFAREKSGVDELLAAWRDDQSWLRGADLPDDRLALAYALCHALTLERLAHRADSLSIETVPVVGLRDDLE